MGKGTAQSAFYGLGLVPTCLIRSLVRRRTRPVVRKGLTADQYSLVGVEYGPRAIPAMRSSVGAEDGPGEGGAQVC
jgi:hypothetical protein